MTVRFRFPILASCLAFHVGAAQPTTLDATSARPYFAEAEQLCDGDASALWGLSMCGPMMIVDPSTRRVVANVADVGGNLRRDGDLFVGALPQDVGIANTAVTWGGTVWTMLRWPLPADEAERGILLMHEAWHRIQPQLGLTASEHLQRHLATLDGRLSLRLELRALRLAVTLDGEPARAAFGDAVLFRSWRYARFPQAHTDEAALEANEGLAEYTGWTVSRTILDRGRLARHLDRGDQAPSLARNFAYYTGPAYGALLDRFSPGWRGRARAEIALPLGEFLTHGPVGPRAFAQRAEHYGLAQLRSEERRSDAIRRHAERRWRSALVTGPTLTIPMMGANIVFDPNSVQPLAQGNVYPTLVAKGPWGSLDAQGGTLVSADWSTITLPAATLTMSDGSISAPGWRLVPGAGWSVQGSPGRRRLVKSTPGRRRPAARSIRRRR